MQRPSSSMGRPSSAMRPGTGRGNPFGSNRPGTSSMRLGTANMRPGTSARPGTGNKSSPFVNTRSVTNQGVSGINPVPGFGRQIADKSYYVTELRARITELSTEIERMNSEIYQFEKENANSVALERKFEALSKEVATLQSLLKNYNFLIDRLQSTSFSSGTIEADELNDEAKQLHQKNESQRKVLDSFFTEKNSKENQKREIEQQNQHLQLNIERQLNQLSNEDRDRYTFLKEENKKLNNDIAKQQSILEEILQEELKLDPAKQKSLLIYDDLHQLQKQKTVLEEETNQTLSVPEEIERLTQRVKATNAEIVEVEARTSSTLDKINKMREQLSVIEKQMSESKTDRVEKFRELVKKDKDMTAFIEKYESSKEDHEKDIIKLEASISNILENVSKLLSKENSIPSPDNYDKLKQDLQFKANQMEASQTTATRLTDGKLKLLAHLLDLQQRKSELQKMQSIDQNIASEMIELKEKMNKMNEEMRTFGEIENVKLQFEKGKEKLLAEKHNFIKRKELLGQENAFLSQDIEEKENLLKENEVHKQLEVLEKSLKHYEQNNFSMKEYISVKGKESDYRSMIPEITNLVTEINLMLLSR